MWTSKKSERELRLDIRSMEELFSQVEKRPSIRRTPGQKTCDDVDVAKESQVTILDSKRSMNISIFLRQFKRPVKDIVQDIYQGNWKRFGSGKLQELCKMLPEDTEVKKLLSFTGNMAQLPEADQFMVELVKVPGYVERLKSMVLREEFFPLMEEVKHTVTVLINAANELLDCDDLHTVIQLVLKAGNYMNAGGYNENAIGFRMTTLLNLADTKANKPGMNLMHYVAKQAEDIDRELLTFPVQLEHIGRAARMCKEEVVADFIREAKKIEDVKCYASRQPDLFEQMETFLIRADAKLVDIECSLKALNSVSSAVAEFFCEDAATFKLQECCSIFHSFCTRIDTAVQENREREAAEERRKHKESIRASAKRRPTVSQTKLNSDQDPSELESALHTFLSSVPGSATRPKKNPHPGPSPRSGSVKVEHSTRALSPDKTDKNQAKPCSEEMEKIQKEEKRDVKRKVLRHQEGRSNLDHKDRGVGAPRYERASHLPSTPRTPQARNRHYVFVDSGSSPWTILSPVYCRRRNTHDQNKTSQKGSSRADDPDEGLWESVDVTYVPDSTTEESMSSSISCTPIDLKLLPRSPLNRSASVDESRRSPTCASRFGDFFQRSFVQRSYSSGSRSDDLKDNSFRFGKSANPFDNSALKSFFKRIGNRRKPGDFDEPDIVKSCI